MFAFAGMLISAAEKAGISIPDDVENYDKDVYAYFHVFCIAQLGQPMPYPGVHWDNAKIISHVSKEEIKKITLEDLIKKGFMIGNSYDNPWM